MDSELLEINKEIRQLVRQEVDNQKVIINILTSINEHMRLLEKRSRRDINDIFDAVEMRNQLIGMILNDY